MKFAGVILIYVHLIKSTSELEAIKITRNPRVTILHQSHAARQAGQEIHVTLGELSGKCTGLEDSKTPRHAVIFGNGNP